MISRALNSLQAKRNENINSNKGFLSTMFGATTKSGVSVNSSSALTISAFFNGVNIIANDIAKLPKSIYKKEGKNSLKSLNHSLQYLIAKRPNQYMTSFSFHFVLGVDAILKGDGIAEIIRNKYSGRIEAFQLVDQDKTPVTIKKFEEKLYYHFDGRVVSSEDIIHVPGFSFNGISGIGVIQQAAKSLGVALESQEFAQEYYANKGIGLGVVTSQKEISDDQKPRIAKQIGDDLTAKAKGRFGVTILDQMGSFQHIKITPQEALFLETNQMAIGEVARWLNLPVYKLKDTQNQNNSNMEHQSISHVVDSILPWKIKFEQEYDYKCFSLSEKKQGYYVKFNTKVLLQADSKTQSEYYSKMIAMGIMTPNEARSKEDLNPIDGLDKPFMPVNMQTLEQFEVNLKLKQKELKIDGE